MSAATRLAGMVALIVPAALLAGAYIGEYVFDLYPCEMCWWQRYALFAALAAAVIAWFAGLSRPFLWLAALGLLASGLLGGFHAGVEYGWWEGITACTATPAASGADALEAILNAPLVRCDQVQWSLLGISLAGWNFLFSVAAALAIALLLTRRRKDG